MQILSRSPLMEDFRMASSRVGGEGGIALAQGLSAGALLACRVPHSMHCGLLAGYHAPPPNCTLLYSGSALRSCMVKDLSRQGAMCAWSARSLLQGVNNTLTTPRLEGAYFRQNASLPRACPACIIGEEPFEAGVHHLRSGSRAVTSRGHVPENVHACCWHVQAAAW